MHDTFSPNIRDTVTTSGQGYITWKKKVFTGIPQIIMKMIESISEIKTLIKNIDNETLSYYWENSPRNNYLNWIDMVIENTKHMKLSIDLKEYHKQSTLLSIPKRGNLSKKIEFFSIE